MAAAMTPDIVTNAIVAALSAGAVAGATHRVSWNIGVVNKPQFCLPYWKPSRSPSRPIF
jgi:hypothetical protein